MVSTTQHPKNPSDVFDKLPQDILCSRELHQRFAGWLTDQDNGYKIADGVGDDGNPKMRSLAASTCINYMQDLMGCVKTKFGVTGTAESKLFLQCTVPKSGDDYLWWKQLRRNVIYKLCKIHTENGDAEDKAAAPLYPDPHITGIIRSLLRKGTPDSVRRAFEILTTTLTCGRSGESAYIVRDSIMVNQYLQCIFLEVPQCKVFAYKMIPLCPSKIRYLDWYLLFVLMLCLVGYGVHDEDQALWLMPHLQTVKEPAQMLGNIIKDLLPGPAGSKEYKDLAVESLPPNASAAGIRKGAVDYLDGLLLDKDVCRISGHAGDDAAGVTILNSYRQVNWKRSKLAASALVGWPMGEYGRARVNGGPFPPSLTALGLDAASSATLTKIIDKTLHIHSASDPRLQSEGDDRFVVDTGFATLLMNYGNMLTAGEAVSVLDQLRIATKTFWGGDDQVHSMLLSWGALIQSKFDRDNLSITTRTQQWPEIDVVVTQIVAQGHTLSEVQMKQNRFRDDQARVLSNQALILAQNKTTHTNQRNILSQQAQILTLLQGGGGKSVGKVVAVEGEESEEIDGSDKSDIEVHESDTQEESEITEVAPRSINNALTGGGQALMSTCKHVSTISLYILIVQGDDNVPSCLSNRTDQLRARLVRLAYNCLIKEPEKDILRNRKSDEATVERLKAYLDHLLLALFLWACVRSQTFQDKKIPSRVATNFDGTSDFTANSLESYWLQVKDQLPRPTTDKNGDVLDFQNCALLHICTLFRDTYESYCKVQKNLTRTLGGVNSYLGSAVKYPTSQRFIKDIRDGNFKGNE